MSRANRQRIAVITKDRLEEANVVTTKNINWRDYETFYYTMTGNCVFSDINLPGEGTKTITLHITGNFSPTWPAGWTDEIRGIYVGTVLNLVVVEYTKSATPFFIMDISQPD